MARGLLMEGLKWQEGSEMQSDRGEAVGELRAESIMLSRTQA